MKRNIPNRIDKESPNGEHFTSLQLSWYIYSLFYILIARDRNLFGWFSYIYISDAFMILLTIIAFVFAAAVIISNRKHNAPPVIKATSYGILILNISGFLIFLIRLS